MNALITWWNQEKRYPSGATFKRGDSLLLALGSLVVLALLLVGTVAFLSWDMTTLLASWRWDTTHSVDAILAKDQTFAIHVLLPLFGVVVGLGYLAHRAVRSKGHQETRPR